MIRASKLIITGACILSSILNYANASDINDIAKIENIQAAGTSDINLLDLNVYAWAKMTPGNQGGINYVKYVLANNYDFVTTQEAEGNTVPLTNPSFGNMAATYTLMNGYNGDAAIYYNHNIWQPNGDLVTMPVTRDGGGSRVAAFVSFTKKGTSKTVVIATTHLCINWGKGDCIGGQNAAHTADVVNIASEVKRIYGNVPLILTGDFNSTDNNPLQNQNIKNALSLYSLIPVKGNSPEYLGPTFGANTIDFIYYTGASLTNVGSNLYTAADGNQSDHLGLASKFNLGETPPPSPCDAPTDADTLTKTYTPTSSNAGTINIGLSSHASSTTGMEIWPWNYNQQGVIPKKVSNVNNLNYEDKNVSGSSHYTYYIRNICQGNFSSFHMIDIPVQQ